MKTSSKAKAKKTEDFFALGPTTMSRKERQALKCKKRIRDLHHVFDIPIPKEAKGKCPPDCPTCYARCPHCKGLLDKEKIARL